MVSRADGGESRGAAPSKEQDTTTEEEAVPSRSERRIDAWTALAAEPAVRAADRAIATESATVLADTLSLSTTAEARRRLARVLELGDRADADPAADAAYRRAVDELRAWAAGVYLATLREPEARLPPTAGRGNPHTEEGISLRRRTPRPPFPGQRKRLPFAARGGARRRRPPAARDLRPAGPRRAAAAR